MTLTVVGGRACEAWQCYGTCSSTCCFCAPLRSPQRNQPTMLRSQLKRLSEEPIVRGQNAHPSSGGDPNLFWRRGIFATIVQLEKPIATLYLADKPTRVLSHCCARAILEARGCEIVSKVILPGYRWFAQQARAFIITALSRNSKCGFALRWTPSFVRGGVWSWKKR